MGTKWGRKTFKAKATKAIEDLGLRPIVIDIEDPVWLEEAKLVASVTGRQTVILSEDSGPEASAQQERIRSVLGDGHPGRGGLILLVDRSTPLCSVPGVRVHRVDLMEPNLAEGGSVDLAEMIGREDPLRIAVIGAHGGAGTSLFAAGLAAALKDILARDALLIDRDPHSQGLATVLGIENQPGWMADDVRASVTEKELLQNCQEIDGVQVLGRMGGGFVTCQRSEEHELPLHRLMNIIQRAVIVVDCGRTTPGSEVWEKQWGAVIPDAVVVVSSLTVAGLAGAKDMGFAVEDAGLGDPMHVVRRVPYSATTGAMAMVLLDTKPEAEWAFDDDLAFDLDRGALNLRSTALHKASHAVGASIVASRAAETLELGEAA
ncbi:hypothetical protein CUROG_09680 [Corynebacterium urogenitale]|uniref:Helicase/secretion neighborhood CpaE-like protein n=1 Tax=Corynebacterium urogenitale TaxID=2487892 RepID=A0A5J6ZCJ0_9CORY|nr:hypothetical protein [Corynebacterium urogenitale]QFQ03277.1 hypothetical protein CUROG_09680 [Corynebacterium urogenitale]